MIERRLEVQRLVRHADPVDGFDDLFIRDARGIADIDDDLHLALAELDHVGRHREAARLVVELGQPAGIAEQDVDDALDAGIALFEVAEQGQHGVDAELGRGAVRALADGDELLAARLKAPRLRTRRHDAARERFAAAAHHVGRGAALEIEEGRPVEIKVKAQLQNALLRIDDGEIGIGREARFGQVRHLVVMFDALPAALFVAADDEFDLLLGDKALVFERLQGIERADCGALVVRRAAAPDLPFRNFAAEGIVRPAVARGNDVEMAEHRKLLPFPEEDFAHIIFEIMRLEAHPLRKGEEICKALGCALAEGHFGRPLRERGICSDEVRDRPDRFFLITFH